MSTELKPTKIKFTEYHKPALPDGEYEITITQNLSKIIFELAPEHFKNSKLPQDIINKLVKFNKKFDTEEEFINGLRTDVKLTDTEIHTYKVLIYSCLPTSELISPKVTKTFYVAGERFQITPKEIASVFPPASSLGDHSNVFPHIMINRSTLPWERKISTEESDKDISWLGLIVIHDDEKVEIEVMKLGQVMDLLNVSKLEPGQSAEDKVQVLKIKNDILEPLLPKKDHLRYLTHVRQGVDDAGKLVGAEMAVIIANRLPKKGGTSTVYLVSFENRFNKNGFVFQKDKDDNVCLVQLHSWSFTCESDAKGDFAALLNKLDISPSALRKTDIKDANVDKYLQMGFYPLPHKLREGYQTVSWYHGPLGTGDVTFDAYQRVSTSGSLLNYYEDNGMIDVSYAAAWELGRLLALQNTNFSTELYKWKQQYKKTSYKAKQSSKNAHLPWANLDNTAAPLPTSVSDWLFGLNKLEGVPFNYLVPEEELLPLESIRFFKLNKAWMYALQEGALSIGRVTGKDKDHEVEDVIVNVFADRLKDRKVSMEVVTGFILRSEAVSGWPGMQIEAYNKKLENNEIASDDNKLKILRNANLSPNVKICLFAGELQTLSLHLKPEALHFGLDYDGKTYSKKLRDNKGKENDKIVIDVPLKEKKVLDVNSLRESYKKENSDFDSSGQLAIRLLQGVEEVRWTL